MVARSVFVDRWWWFGGLFRRRSGDLAEIDVWLLFCGRSSGHSPWSARTVIPDVSRKLSFRMPVL
jgi:hypothetical protein